MRLLILNICLSCLFGSFNAVPFGEYEILFEQIGYKINNHPDATWTAGINENFAGWSLQGIKNMLGGRMHPKISPSQIRKPVVRDELPEKFDSRFNWPKCQEVISTIRDQGNCGSCWAVAAAEVASDRTCIHSNGEVKEFLSSNRIISCCSYCGDGCLGGYAMYALRYWQEKGLVTGGTYGSNHGCQPYYIAPCPHPCYNPAVGYAPTPDCGTIDGCSVDSAIAYDQDKHFGNSSYYINPTESDIMLEIMQRGPVAACFDEYEDFGFYRSGVYQHMFGKLAGGHCVKIIGWGATKDQNKTPYWLVMNQWGVAWGDRGYFKILRGSNECEIESSASGGLPNLNPTFKP